MIDSHKHSGLPFFFEEQHPPHFYIHFLILQHIPRNFPSSPPSAQSTTCSRSFYCSVVQVACSVACNVACKFTCYCGVKSRSVPSVVYCLKFVYKSVDVKMSSTVSRVAIRRDAAGSWSGRAVALLPSVPFSSVGGLGK